MTVNLADIIAEMRETEAVLADQLARLRQAIAVLEGGTPPAPVSPPGPIREPPPAPTVPPKRPAPAANFETFTGGRRTYSDAEKAEAVALARQIGVTLASGQLGIHQTTINAWRRRRKVPDVEVPVIKQPPITQSTPDAHDTPDPDRPYVCSCGARFDTAYHWNAHRSGATGRHLLVDQPARTFDDDQAASR